MNDGEAKLIEKWVDGCTEHMEYECPCGKGRVVEERVRGFGDYWARLKCRDCEKRYEIVTGCGYIWELREVKTTS